MFAKMEGQLITPEYKAKLLRQANEDSELAELFGNQGEGDMANTEEGSTGEKEEGFLYNDDRDIENAYNLIIAQQLEKQKINLDSQTKEVADTMIDLLKNIIEKNYTKEQLQEIAKEANVLDKLGKLTIYCRI